MDDGRSNEVHGPRLFFRHLLSASAQAVVHPAPSCIIRYSSFLALADHRIFLFVIQKYRQRFRNFLTVPMPQSPREMFADKGYEGWDELSPRQKVERMLAIHKSGHEGEDVSLSLILFYP